MVAQLKELFHERYLAIRPPQQSKLDFEELAGAPVEALAGISPANAAALRTTLGIRTVGDLGRNRSVIAAVAVAVLAEQTNQLIARHIEPNPQRPGRDEARLIDSGVPVWALAGYWAAVDGNDARVAADYALPAEAVEAALAYYRRHKPLIDARIEANTAPVA